METNFTDILTLQAKQQPDAIAIYTVARFITYQNLDRYVWQMATYLKKEDIKPGDIVVNQFDDDLLLVIVMLAIARTGATILSIPSNMPDLQLQDIIKKVNPSSIVKDEKTKRSIQLPTIIVNYKIFNEASSTIDYTVYTSLPKAPWQIIIGSGSTGNPKLFSITHEQENARLLLSKDWYTISKDDRIASFSELHYASIKRRFCETLTAGASYIILPKNHNPIMILQKYQVTILYSAVSHIIRILQNLPNIPKGQFSSLKVLSVGASAVNSDLRERIRTSITPNLYVRYGTNDVGSISNTQLDHVYSIPGTVGKPIKGLKVEIVDNKGKRKETDEIGLIRIKSPGATNAYLYDDEATQKAFKDGWFYPGDLGKFTEDGQLIHMGRSDHMMIMNGINIYPAEIEQVITSHPDVLDAAAVPIKSSFQLDIPICAVVLSKKSSLTEKELLEYTYQHLSVRSAKRIIILDSIPRNERGKLIRQKLFDEIKIKITSPTL